MPDLPPPPQVYQDFTERFPGLTEAWELIGAAGADGPLQDPALRLLKLAVAIGGMRKGAILSSVRKARALGVSRGAIEQVVALAAGTIGLPTTIEAFRLVQEGFAQCDAFEASEQASEAAETTEEEEGDTGEGEESAEE
jgi:4-carboxymuconolactone decarboxylase